MIKTFDNNFILNNLLKNVSRKKLYIQTLKKKISVMKIVKKYNYKKVHSFFFNTKKKYKDYNNFVMYIINISFSKTNTSLHVMNPSGELKFFCSAGNFSYTGKAKKSRHLVLKPILRILIRKLKFLRQNSIAVHLINVKFFKRRILKYLRKKFSVEIVRNFSIQPYNGCRKKKVSRKKFKKRITRRNGWAV